VGGGKPKMRHYFSIYGWPTSSILGAAPASEDEQTQLVDLLQVRPGAGGRCSKGCQEWWSMPC
jgi:hypothetical protein